MNRDKQIEEMRKTFEVCDKEFFQFCSSHESCLDCPYCNKVKSFYKLDACYTLRLQETLVDKGYRKASEVALEVIGEIEKIIDKHYNNHIFGNNDLDDLEHDAIINFSDDVTHDIDDLKKKYTEGER